MAKKCDFWLFIKWIRTEILWNIEIDAKNDYKYLRWMIRTGGRVFSAVRWVPLH